MHKIIFFSLLFLVLASPLYGTGQIFFYEDESGCLHFTDNPTEDNRFKPFLFFRAAVQSMAPEAIAQLIEKYSLTYGVDRYLVTAVIKVESNFESSAVSHAGAQGLMQIMPETGRELGLDKPFNPENNLEAGIRYLRMMLDRFGDLSLALAAYNAGPGNVEKYGGIPPFAETLSYVKKVLWHYNQTKARS